VLLHGGLGSGEMFGVILPGRAMEVSANIRRGAIYPEMLEQQVQVNAAAAEFMKETPMYELYQRVAPHPEAFPQLLDKAGEAMAQDFDYTNEVRGLQVPTLIVAADADMAPPSNYVEVFGLLDGGACGTAAGWTRAARRAATRWPSFPAPRTTTSSTRRCWPLRPPIRLTLHNVHYRRMTIVAGRGMERGRMRPVLTGQDAKTSG
jgi:hypothetical protein